ncbi:histone deacetylase family protein [Paracoccus sanguinis]|uniref:Acetoin utilization deacetylase AcuC n=1 Tax=Paracoccus sanguinis TaxID=1545044 RepID=A0A1H2SUK5_9RHOB|nr:histone deacetylase family protein [Paracoccus sanguinis]KGJ19296.1 acetylpolyamine aminohydrolase [Paracoccus sanguinis]SDW34714.1 Acetoin utilization deacetylase AcuC [Paracoccus sanguinis]
MRAFYHPDQALHDPQQYLRFGRVVAAKDLPERTTRLLDALDRHGIRPEHPVECGLDPVLAVHAEGFVDFLRTAWDEWQTLPPERGPEVWPATFPYWSGRPDAGTRPPSRATGILGRLGWYLGDMSVPMGPDAWRSVLRSAETAVAGADALCGGEAAVFALCRPSGHHARTDRASGFCYLNNAAIAAQRLRERFARVAVLDVDVHHGDGTQQVFYDRDDVLTVSIHGDPADFYPFYTGFADERGHGAGEGANLNLPLPPGAAWPQFEAALTTATAAIRNFGADALVVALGYDAHEADPIGILKLTSADFRRVGAAVRALGRPTLIVQEGGYAVEVIGDCLDAFLTGLQDG